MYYMICRRMVRLMREMSHNIALSQYLDNVGSKQLLKYNVQANELEPSPFTVQLVHSWVELTSNIFMFIVLLFFKWYF